VTFLMQRMSRWRAIGAVVLVAVGMCGLAAPQQASSDNAASSAVVTFTLDFPESEPTHYSIAVDANGHASYECTVKVEDSDEQTYRWEFDVTPGNRERIFEWTKQAKYFSGKIDSGNRKLAFTGEKILSYQDGQRSVTVRYNYSSLEPVRQLTALFQNMAGTLDYGRRLTYYHRSEAGAGRGVEAHGGAGEEQRTERDPRGGAGAGGDCGRYFSDQCGAGAGKGINPDGERDGGGALTA